MHMISKKDLSNAEMDTLTNLCSPTIVINANGEVQTHEEAELEKFLTVKVLALANKLTNRWVSSDQRPPTSTTRTTSRALARGPSNSG